MFLYAETHGPGLFLYEVRYLKQNDMSKLVAFCDDFWLKVLGFYSNIYRYT